jgi:hypothetical protein
MGLDVTVSSVVGIPLVDFAKLGLIRSSVTKYDPDTGKPYQKPLEKRTLIINGKEVLETEADSLSGAVNEWLVKAGHQDDDYDQNPRKMSVVDTSPDDDDDVKLVGIRVGKDSDSHRSGTGNWAEAGELKEIQSAFKTIEGVLAGLGVTAKPKLYAVPYYSY